MAKKTDSPPQARAEPDPNGPIIHEGEQITPQPDPFAHLGDEHWGKGGRYIVGEDGKRTPAPETPVITEKEPLNG